MYRVIALRDGCIIAVAPAAPSSHVLTIQFQRMSFALLSVSAVASVPRDSSCTETDV